MHSTSEILDLVHGVSCNKRLSILLAIEEWCVYVHSITVLVKLIFQLTI